MQTFDIVLEKMHLPSVYRFDGDIFLPVQFDYQNQSGDDTTEV